MTQTTPKKMSVDFIINGEKIKKRTTDLVQTIAEVAPAVVHTEMYLTVKKDGHRIDRRIGIIEARRIFRDAFSRQVFVNNLNLAHYV